MPQATIPNRPLLKTIPGVELIKVGQWPASTGVWDATPDDLVAAVAAAQSPCVRNPVIKLGHCDARFDGEPAVGWVDNLQLADNGSTLVGDFRGIPEWLADILPSAYPDRSIEGQYGYVDQTGRSHGFALTAVALLGVMPPAVGTLTSLQDIAALYGVQAKEEPLAGTPVRFTISQKGTQSMTTPTVSAAQSVEDVRRSFYEGPAASNWWWIEQLYVDPAEVIAVDDDTGELYRIAYTLSEDEVTWAEPETVKREYVAASSQVPAATWASAEESRPEDLPATPVGDSENPEEEGAAMPTFTKDQTAEMLSVLGLDTLDDPAAVAAAVSDLKAKTTDGKTDGAVAASSPREVAAAAEKLGMSVIDAGTLAEIKAQAAEGAAARKEMRAQERRRQVSAAISTGKIPSSRREHWEKAIEADAGMSDVLAAMADNLVPVKELGHNGDAVGASIESSAEDLTWFDGK